MTQYTQKIPFKISEYINAHFREDFLFRLKGVRRTAAHTHYQVEVTKDNMIYQLRFNEHGDLLREEAALAFPPDIHEEPPGEEEVRPDDF